MKEYRNLTRPELEAELSAVRAADDALKAAAFSTKRYTGETG